MANPFYVQPGNNFGQGIQGLAQGISQVGQVRREEAAQMKQQEYMQQAKKEVGEALQSGDPAKIRDVMVKYPEIQKEAEAAFGFTNDQTRQIAGETYRRALSDPERAAEYMDQGIQAVAAAGGNPNNMLQDYAMLKVAPEQALKSMKAGYAALANEQEYKMMFGDKPDELKVGRYRQITLPDGSIATLDTATNDVTPIAEAPPVDLSILPEDMQESVARQPMETQRKIVESFAMPSAQSKQDEVLKQKEKAAEVTTKTKNLVKELLKNESGIRAVVGGVDEMLPTLLPGSKDAEAALEDLRNMLTVDNLKLMTGVLSESDMKVLRSVGASGLTGSQDRVIETLKRLQKALSGGGSDLDDLVNKYAD